MDETVMAQNAELMETHERCQALVETADAEKRGMTDGEQLEFDQLFEKFDETKIKLDHADRSKKLAAVTEYLTRSAGRKVPPAPIAAPHQTGPPQVTGTGFRFRDVETGREIRALRADEPMPESRADDDLSVGRCLHAILTGRVEDMSELERRAMLGSLDTGGGYMLTPTLSARVIDLARSASVVMRAGASTIPMNTSELQLARVSADPTTSWRREGTAITSSKPTLERITLQARTLAAIVPISIELIEDAANAPRLIEDVLRKALGQKLDEAALVGTGASGQPTGVRNATGVNSRALGTSPPTTWAHTLISLAIGDILTANFQGQIEDLAWIRHPRDAVNLDEMTDSTTQPLQPTPWAAAVKKFTTTALPITEGGSSDESTTILGDFSQMLIGMRTTGVVIEILNAGTVTDSSSDSFNATDSMLRHVRAYLRADVALMHADFFTLTTAWTA